MYDFSYLEYYKMQDNMLNLKIGICNGSTETENFIERMVCKKRKMSGISVPVLVGGTGIQRQLEMEYSQHELYKIKKSKETIKRHLLIE